jgi:cellobiose-specific phosphotransferase system component IIB
MLAAGVPLPLYAQGKIVLGFAQVGAESEWRTANTESIKSSAKDAGIELKFSDAQQKQENQIKAIRSFIAQGVDAIFLAPVVASGWDAVLKEAKEAKIPVVLLDRDWGRSRRFRTVPEYLGGTGVQILGRFMALALEVREFQKANAILYALLAGHICPNLHRYFEELVGRIVVSRPLGRERVGRIR